MKSPRLLRLAAGVISSAAIVEGIGLLVDAGREKPQLWHDLLTERKYLQMCSLAVRGGADIAFVGCSHSVLGIDAQLVADQLEIERPGFNAALYRAVPNVASHWLENVVLPLLRPTIVVWGLSPLHFNDNGILHREMEAKYRGSLAQQARRPVPWPREVLRRSFVARLPISLSSGRRKETVRSLRNAVKRLRDGNLSLLTIPGELDRNGLGNVVEGFSYLNTPRQRYVVEVETAGDFEIVGTQLANVERGVRAAQATGARVVFARMPITDDVTPSFPRGELDIEDGDAAMRTLAARLGVVVIDFSDEVERDLALFADFVHLNGVGRHAFSKRLGATLRSELHRGRSLDAEADADAPVRDAVDTEAESV